MIVYVGAVGALAAMTVLSAAIGFALPNLLPRMYTHYAATVLVSVNVHIACRVDTWA